MIDVWKIERVMGEFRTFNQWIPHFSISETFQNDGEEVISCPEISKNAYGNKARGFRIYMPGFDILP